ncbi:MAG: hypothetical protein VYD57_13425 [Pseudomonadota bacterium]|nr:hypothetical protein [Pseudomonadota bacterium]
MSTRGNLQALVEAARERFDEDRIDIFFDGVVRIVGLFDAIDRWKPRSLSSEELRSLRADIAALARVVPMFSETAIRTDHFVSQHLQAHKEALELKLQMQEIRPLSQEAKDALAASACGIIAEAKGCEVWELTAGRDPSPTIGGRPTGDLPIFIAVFQYAAIFEADGTHRNRMQRVLRAARERHTETLEELSFESGNYDEVPF